MTRAASEPMPAPRPEDVGALQALLLAAWTERDSIVAERDGIAAERDTITAERDSVAAERDALAEQNDRLRHLLLRLKRLQFGLEDLESAIAQGEADAEQRDPALRARRAARRRASRGALPSHLPRVEVTLTPEDSACPGSSPGAEGRPCCRGAMAVIGHDTAERLDVIPAQFRVIVTKRPKLACRACAGTVVQAPARLIEGGLPTEALAAHVLVSRCADHLPLYRQARIMARQGVALERSTLASWVGYAAAEIAPVVDRLRTIVLGSARVFADETTLPVLDPGRGRTKTGYLWAAARDGRSWGGTDPPAVVYAYAPGRGQLHADTLLGACASWLLRPGQGRHGPGDFAARNTEIATEALERIAALYRIEAEVRGQASAQRLTARRERSRPLVLELRAWFEQQLARLPGRSPAAGAIRYALNHWAGLVRCLDDGRIELDTNVVERAIRPIKLSRKNALFAGGDEGGANWAHIASLVETCKLNGVDPQAYFADLLSRLVNGWPQARIDDLMPWHWVALKNS